jgi:hypothetical protein
MMIVILLLMLVPVLGPVPFSVVVGFNSMPALIVDFESNVNVAPAEYALAFIDGASRFCAVLFD